MDLYEAFEPKLIDEPKEFSLGPDTFITLAPTGGERQQRQFQKLMSVYAPRLNAGQKLTDEENKNLNVEFFAKYVVRGWRGLKVKGEAIAYTPENAMKLLADPKLDKFFALIIRMATNDAAFEAEIDESDEGNS